MSHYDTLGVAKDASQAEIKKAFKRLASRYHPDKGNGGDPEKFHHARQAYETLMDEDDRAHYDRTGQSKGHRGILQQKAEEVVAQILLQLAENNGYEKRDYIQEAKNSIHQNRTKISKDLRKLEHDLEKVAYLLDNLEGDDEFFKRGLASRYQQISEGIDQRQEMLEVIGIAIGRLEKCRYTGEKVETPMGGFHFSGPGFFSNGG